MVGVIFIQAVAANSHFIPSYEVRSSLESASDLKQSLDTLSGELLPKKKFSFKSKPSSSTTKFQKRDLVSPPNVTVVRDSPGFRNKHGETLSKSFESIGEFTLSDLDSCQVKLIGTVNALFVNGLRKLQCIHRSRFCVCDFYLRVRSRPIIEDSNAVRFVPYCLDYGGIEKDLKTADLEEETELLGQC
ncbi:hypothetical protein Bca52824_012292 [Brassica carinata]|uniref:C-CAP/cofactor C-like domain-containing protein n=1 Tax=Brassica carinata TaxID=52824 RepID=A0A8X7VW74_BRACI|nr:hypothetical protein Bca52824_012292 [Brassica carinata]